MVVCNNRCNMNANAPDPDLNLLSRYIVLSFVRFSPELVHGHYIFLPVKKIPQDRDPKVSAQNNN